MYRYRGLLQKCNGNFLHVAGHDLWGHVTSSLQLKMAWRFFPWGLMGKDFTRITVDVLNTIQLKYLQFNIF